MPDTRNCESTLIEMNSPTTPPPSASKSDRPVAFLFVFPSVALLMFLSLSDQSIIATALPSIAGSLGGAEQISLVVIGYLVSATVAAPIYGRLGDVFGRRALILVALAIFMSAALLCSFAVSMPMLVVGRILQGVGGGGLMALAQALIGESIAPRDRMRYQGYLASVGIISNGLGPVLGGILSETFGWRSIFYFFLPLGALAFVLIWRLPRRPTQNSKTEFDYVGSLLFACFVASMLWLLQLIQRFDMSEWIGILALMVVVLTSFYLLIRVESRLNAPLLPIDLFRNPTIWRAVSAAACHGAIFMSLLTFVPLYLRVVHGSSASQTGLLLVPMTIGVGIGSIVTGQIASRTGRTAIIPSWGLVFVVIGLLGIALYAPNLRTIELSVGLGLVTLFLGTVMTVIQVTVQVAADGAKLGVAAASVQYSRTLGAALGTAIVAMVQYATLANADPEAGRLFPEVLRHGPAALDTLSAARSASVHAAFAGSFQAAFLVMAAFAALSVCFIWTMPLRRI